MNDIKPCQTVAARAPEKRDYTYQSSYQVSWEMPAFVNDTSQEPDATTICNKQPEMKPSKSLVAI